MTQRSKLDSALDMALSSVKSDTQTISVFIYFKEPLSQEKIDFLINSGIFTNKLGKKIITAYLQPSEIYTIASQDWVAYLRLGSHTKNIL